MAHDEERERRTRALLGRVADGDREAVGELYALYRGDLLSHAHARCGETLAGLLESADLVQSVWADVAADVAGFEDRGPGSFGAWLGTCLEHKIAARGRFHGAARRDAHRRVPLEGGGERRAPELPGDDPTPSRLVGAEDELERLLAVLRRLPEGQREVLLLRLRDELSFAEIGERLGRSAEAARKLHARALEAVAELWPGASEA